MSIVAIILIGFSVLLVSLSAPFIATRLRGRKSMQNSALPGSIPHSSLGRR